MDQTVKLGKITLVSGGASGTINITENGTYDVGEYLNANVNVPNSGSGIVPTGKIGILENGTYDVTNYAEANVNVPIPDGYIKPAGTINITANGIHDVTQYANVNINVPTGSGNSEFTKKLLDRSITEVSAADLTGLTSIGDSAFSDCSSLTSITLPEGLTSIGNYAFSNCSNLTSITLPDSITSIGDSAFSNCSNLTSITLPEGLTSIGNYAFWWCDRLQCVFYGGTQSNYINNVSVGSNNTSLDDARFIYERKNVTFTSVVNNDWSYVLTNNNEIIGLKCLNKNIIVIGCNLNEIFSGYTILSLGYKAFYNCSSLTSITIPESVTSIGGYAFRGCSSLTSITFLGTMTQWNSISFASGWNNYVPATYVQCSDGTVSL